MSDAYMWSSLTHMPQIDTNWATTTRQPQSDLDRDAFLNLLITQLRHQDPLNPMDDSQFIAQMAQFSTLEQMMQLNNTFERTQAFGMIGKIIDADFFCPVREEWIEIDSRFVTAVRRSGDNVYLTVMGENGMPVDVPFDSVREVSEDFFVTQQLFDIFSSVNAQRATDLVGRYIQALSVNGDNTVFVEGRVDSVKFAEGGAQAVLVVGNREVFLPEVFSVAPGMQLIGSTNFTNGGVLTDVIIADNRAYLVFDNNPAVGARVRINRINHATEALIYVGQDISHQGVDGRVRTITINGGIPFLDVYDIDTSVTPPVWGNRRGQVDFLDYLVTRAGGEHSAGGNNPAALPPSEQPAFG